MKPSCTQSFYSIDTFTLAFLPLAHQRVAGQFERAEDFPWSLNSCHRKVRGIEKAKLAKKYRFGTITTGGELTWTRTDA
jgi:hypothetical protein